MARKLSGWNGKKTVMYDDFSQEYDLFVNWSSRLDYELPFIEATLQELKLPDDRPGRVLDAACGTGWHAIALKRKGWQTVGTDFSGGMIEQARQNALAAQVAVPFIQAGFGELASQLYGIFEPGGPAIFDSVLCLGNSLPHILDPYSLQAALEDFAACLNPGGLLIIQTRNFDLVMQSQQRWMEPQSQRSKESEWLFLRFYDFLPEGLIDFHIVRLRREGGSAWRQEVRTTRLRPLLQSELVLALQEARFEQIQLHGDMQGGGFDAKSSGNLVIIARRG